MDAPIALAFAAGLVATVNPCGFAMLPAYLSYFMGLDDGGRTRGEALGAAFVVGGVVTAGFLVVFGAGGLVIAAGFRTVIDWIPWMALVVGLAIVALGVAMLAGYELTLTLPKASRGGRSRGLGRVFAFGVSYAIASLSCTLPVFLTVVAGPLSQSSVMAGIVTFIAYGLGMGLVLVAITVALALGKHSVVRRLRGVVRHVNRASGAILLLAGLYILWFWGTNLRSGAGALGGQSAFALVEDLSQRALNLVADHTALVGGVLVVIVAAAAAAVRRRSNVSSEPTSSSDDAAGREVAGKVGRNV